MIDSTKTKSLPSWVCHEVARLTHSPETKLVKGPWLAISSSLSKPVIACKSKTDKIAMTEYEPTGLCPKCVGGHCPRKYVLMDLRPIGKWEKRYQWPPSKPQKNRKKTKARTQ